MPNPRHYNRMLLTLRVIAMLLSAVAVSVLAAIPARPANDQQVIWNLEHDYWRYVVDNNLTAYRSLWHKNFLGWPGVSAEPVRKDHITDWITSQTSKASHFTSSA